MDELGPQPIRFEWKDNDTMLPLDDHSSHWANLLGEIVREFPMHFGSWHNIPAKRKARVLKNIRTQFDLKSHMQSELWLQIKKGIDQHLDKIYTDNKSSLKKDYWVKNPDDETYDNMVRCAQNAQNGQKARSYAGRDPCHLLPSEISRCRALQLKKEMQRLQALGEYTDDRIMVIVRKGTECEHILGFGWVLAGRRNDVLDVPVMSSDDRMSQLLTQLQSQHETGSGSESGNRSGAGGDDESSDDEDVDEDEEDAYS
ncbi:hypothetical protein Tco_0833896 [Tanacetum coccineum]